MSQKPVYILDGARTPFGSFGGSLALESPTQLGTLVASEAIRRSSVFVEAVDNVVFGNVIQSYKGAIFAARHIALDAGLADEVPALTVNRLCGSGLQAVVSVAQEIMLGNSSVGLAGGTENMSMTPYLLRRARFGLRMGDDTLVDLLSEVLTDCRSDVSMGDTAENLAVKYEISREEQDQFALRSHNLASLASKRGRFQEEIVPVSINTRKGLVVVEDDERVRSDTTLSKLSMLSPAFRENGSVTAGNSSGINDGAAALILASQVAVERYKLSPTARILSYGVTGVDPAYMGIGPVSAINLALKRAGLDLAEIDLFEINEAFAAQYLAVERQLELPRDRTNVNGGAIAMGHPVGASGVRILLSLVHELHHRQGRYGVASLCIGGGQGIAIVIERV